MHTESVKVFVTMKSEIFHFPTASYPCFCLSKQPFPLVQYNEYNIIGIVYNINLDDPSIPGKEDSLPKFICPLNVVFVSDPYSEVGCMCVGNIYESHIISLL